MSGPSCAATNSQSAAINPGNGRRRLCPWPLSPKTRNEGGWPAYARPWFILGFGLSVVALGIAVSDNALSAGVGLAGLLLYVLSTWMFRRPAYLYPAVFLAHWALLAYLGTYSGGRPEQASLPSHALTWAAALNGFGFSRAAWRSTAKGPAAASQGAQAEMGLAPLRVEISDSPAVNALLRPSWAHPFLLFAALDVVLWQVVALGGFGTTIVVAAGSALLLGLLATAWRDSLLPYGALGFLVLAVGAAVQQSDPSLAVLLAWLGGLGLGLNLLKLGAEFLFPLTGGRRQIAERLRLWFAPLRNTALVLSGVTVLSSLSVLGGLVPCAFTLAFAGTLYLTLAYRDRLYRLGYLGMAMLETAWAFLLISKSVYEPQWYAIPAGIYFAGVGLLERRHGRKTFSRIVESFGLAVLLVTTFAQSLQREEGTLYFAWLIAEGLLVIWGGPPAGSGFRSSLAWPPVCSTSYLSSFCWPPAIQPFSAGSLSAARGCSSSSSRSSSNASVPFCWPGRKSF